MSGEAGAEVVVGGAIGAPVVLHLHSPGALPFEATALASMADGLGVRTVAVDRHGLAAGERSVAAIAQAILDAPIADLAAPFAVLAWSGGAPFALAVAAAAPERVTRAVLACPLPGWLRGDGAVPVASPRLAAIASGELSGVPGGEELDVVANPWGFALESVRCPIDVWYGGRDDVIPAALVERQLGALATADLRLFPDDTHFLPMGKWPDLLRLAAGK